MIKSLAHSLHASIPMMRVLELGLFCLLARAAATVDHKPEVLSNDKALKPLYFDYFGLELALNRAPSRFFSHVLNGGVDPISSSNDALTKSEAPCPAGSECCEGGGMCLAGDDCVVVNGRKGCCPVGQTCTTSSPTCTVPGYAPCPNDNFCCPAADTCRRDANNNPACMGEHHRLRPRAPQGTTGGGGDTPAPTPPAASPPADTPPASPPASPPAAPPADTPPPANTPPANTPPPDTPTTAPTPPLDTPPAAPPGTPATSPAGTPPATSPDTTPPPSTPTPPPDTQSVTGPGATPTVTDTPTVTGTATGPGATPTGTDSTVTGGGGTGTASGTGTATGTSTDATTLFDSMPAPTGTGTEGILPPGQTPHDVPPAQNATDAGASGTAPPVPGASIGQVSTDSVPAFVPAPSTIAPPPTPLSTVTAASSTFSLEPPAPTATEAAPKGSTNVTVVAQDPVIQYSPQWVTTATCSENYNSKSSNQMGASILYPFNGSAVFMNLNLGLSGLVFTATVDGQTDTVDAYRSTPASCGTGWARFGLDPTVPHTVNVTILGASPNAPPAGAGMSQAALDFQSFTVLAQNSHSSAGGSSAGTTINPSWRLILGSAFAFAVAIILT